MIYIPLFELQFSKYSTHFLYSFQRRDQLLTFHFQTEKSLSQYIFFTLSQ